MQILSLFGSAPCGPKRIVSEEAYHLVISERYQPGVENQAVELRDIYTAMAISKTLPIKPTIKTLMPLQSAI